jgi:hypothetical protein
MTYNVIYFTMDVKSGRDDHPARGEKREPARQAGRAGMGNRKPGTAPSRQAAKPQSRETEKQAYSLPLCVFASLREPRCLPATHRAGKILTHPPRHVTLPAWAARRGKGTRVGFPWATAEYGYPFSRSCPSRDHSRQAPRTARG